MSNFIVLTIMADDRPGIVEKIAAVVSANGGNWLESSMSRLAGKFTGILLVEAPAGNKQSLIDAMQALSAEGISIRAASGSHISETQGQEMLLTVVGNDRPGIVSEISATLARANINVEELTTSCESAPMSAAPLFRARARIMLPGNLARRDLLASLEALSDDLIAELDDPAS